MGNDDKSAPAVAGTDQTQDDAVKTRRTGVKQTKVNTRKTTVRQSDVPRYSLGNALRVPQAIGDNYGKKPTKPLRVAEAMEMSPASSSFRGLIGASTAYGLTEGAYNSDEITITDLGRRIIAPSVAGADTAAMREALLRPRIIREFLKKYDGSKMPDDRIAHNVLEEIGVPADSATQTFKLISEGAKEVGILKSIKGQMYVDLSNIAQMENNIDKEEATSSFVPTEKLKFGGDEVQDVLPIQKSSQANNRVFITHGKNVEIVNQLKELLTFGKFEPIVAAEHETVSKPVPDKVMDDMRSCYAAIIHVGKEVKAMDQEGKEQFFLNQNVLIEIGAAMALYSRRFILLVERGATLPSNLQGLYEVRYEGDKLDYEATMKLLKAFNDFKS